MPWPSADLCASKPPIRTCLLDEGIGWVRFFDYPTRNQGNPIQVMGVMEMETHAIPNGFLTACTTRVDFLYTGLVRFEGGNSTRRIVIKKYAYTSAKISSTPGNQSHRKLRSKQIKKYGNTLAVYWTSVSSFYEFMWYIWLVCFLVFLTLYFISTSSSSLAQQSLSVKACQYPLVKWAWLSMTYCYHSIIVSSTYGGQSYRNLNPWRACCRVVRVDDCTTRLAPFCFIKRKNITRVKVTSRLVNSCLRSTRFPGRLELKRVSIMAVKLSPWVDIFARIVMLIGLVSKAWRNFSMDNGGWENGWFCWLTSVD